jgi:hypothetical protein
LAGRPDLGCNRRVPTDYRISQRVVLGLLGALTAVVGGLLVGVVAVAGALDLPVAVFGTAVVVALLVVLAGGVFLRGRLVVVRLDEVGYRVRMVRGVGVPQARWTDVEDVVATTAAGERCVVLRLRDGRTSTIPVRMLAVDAETFAKELQGHLNRGHGYRRIN